jgi:periplasmic protein TonB
MSAIDAFPFAESRRLQLSRWTMAALLVFTVHAGAALTLLRWPDEETSDSPGSIALELAPVIAAPAIKSPDVAPGPLMEEAMPTPEAAKQPKHEVVEKTPPVERSPLAPEPEVQLPIPRPLVKEKPEEKEDQEITSEQNTRQSSAAPITAAPPPSDATPSEVPTAPAAGISTVAARAQASWHNTLVAHLNRYKRYPAQARAHNIEGVVRIEFTLDRSGQIVSSRVVQSSGSALLDEEAMAMIRRAAPLPAPPQQVSGMSFSLAVPIKFRTK